GPGPIPRHSKHTGAILGIDTAKNTFLYVSRCGSRKIAARWHAEWSVAKRRAPSRATARTLVPSRAEPIRREQPYTFRAKSDWKAPEVDTCPGGTAATNAQWGDAPSSASTGTGWGCGGS